MEDQHQNKTVNNDGVTLPEHDFAGLSQVIQSAKPTLPGTENGFVPLKDFDLAKPYEGYAEYLKNWENRLDANPIDPANAFEKLKEEIKELERKLKDEFEQRISDITDRYDGRTGELKDYHTEVLRLKDDEIRIWQGRVDELKAKNQNLEQQRDDERNGRLDDLRDFHTQRMADLERYHANELALTERFTQRWEEKVQAVETRIEKEQEQLHVDRKNLFKTVLASIKNFSLAKLFK